MKKMMMAVALFLTITTGSAFANTTAVNPKVIKAFNSEFVSAGDVTWTAGEDFFKASFTYNSKYVLAYYSTDGKFFRPYPPDGNFRITPDVTSQYQKNYADYWITDLFEVAKTEGTAYYLTLEDAENVIVVKSTSGSDWVTFKKSKKQ